MFVYRITGRKHALDITGTGAAMYNGRWNKKGTPVLYTGENPEIALLEVLVHASPLYLNQLDILTIEIPDNSVTVLNIQDLPDNWKVYPAPVILSEIGENWVKESRTLALKVPSCVSPTASNYILNCGHKDYSKVTIMDHQKYSLDSRLINLKR